jgi:hypothetical protein
MSEVERLLSDFTGMSISEARVDSAVLAGVTLCFSLSPTPVPVQWKVMFTQISGDKHGSVMSSTDPLIHGNDIVWRVVEGDIPNARLFVEERVEHANRLFQEILADEEARRALRVVETRSPAEIDRLQRILDGE